MRSRAEMLAVRGLVSSTNQAIWLTRDGFLLSNAVLGALLAD
jgi:hypothetical protein